MLTKFPAVQSIAAGYPAAEIFDDRATREIIQRHLRNQDDRITEDDIKQVMTEMTRVVRKPLETAG